MILDTLSISIARTATGSLRSLITGYNQRINNPSVINHKLGGHQASVWLSETAFGYLTLKSLQEGNCQLTTGTRLCTRVVCSQRLPCSHLP